MELIETSIRTADGRARLSGVVQMADAREPVDLWFDFDERYAPFLNDRGDAFMAVLLLPAMVAGEPLVSRAPVSPMLLRSMALIREVYATWYPQRMRSVAVEAPAYDPAAESRVDTLKGSFFSLGVDSFYTLLKNRREAESGVAPITHLFHMRGLEHALSRERHRGGTEPLLEAVAERLGVQVVFGETNFREYFDLDWASEYSGSGLASVALALGRGFSHALIPSGFTWRQLFAWGNHPFTDRLWSTEAVRIDQDGCDMTRAAKIAETVAHEPLAMEHLRVCARNYGGNYNCGVCGKCIRTMITLDGLGLLGDSPAFPSTLPRLWQWRVMLETEQDLAFIEDNLETIARHRGKPGIIRRLRRLRRRFRRRAAMRELLETFGLGFVTSGAAGATRAARQRARTLLRLVLDRKRKRQSIEFAANRSTDTPNA